MGDMYNNIERLCQLKGIKVGRLCADLEISRGVMSNLKNGSTKELSSPTVKKIANYFGVATDVIYGTLTKNGPADNDEARAISDEEIMFALLDGDADEITDEMFSEVKWFAKAVRDKKRRENEKNR